MEWKWKRVGVTTPVSITTVVRSAFKEGGICALGFEMCRFGGGVELLRTVEETAEFYH